MNNSQKAERGKNMAVGCGGTVAFCALALTLLNAEQGASAVAYGTMLAMVVLVARVIFNDFFEDYGWYVWGGVAVLAFALGVAKPIQTSEAADTNSEVVGEVAAETAKAAEEAPKAPKAQKAADVPRPTVEEALGELDELIGLTTVKEEVRKLTSLIQVARQREAAGLKVAKVSYHMVFTGNPGTGKTTVARIMAKIFSALGVLEKDHLVETDAGGLLGSHVGETAEKTNALVDSALGGVLFIDEAYMLGESGYGKEAIATLLKRMEDDRARLVVILAGYPDDMKRFLDSNPGLTSRFSRVINFPDYTADELAELFRFYARRNHYELSPDVEKYLNNAIANSTKKRDRNFGNGRWVRNLFERALERQAIRLAETTGHTEQELRTLELQDVGIKVTPAKKPAEGN